MEFCPIVRLYDQFWKLTFSMKIDFHHEFWFHIEHIQDIEESFLDVNHNTRKKLIQDYADGFRWSMTGGDTDEPYSSIWTC